MFFKKSPHVNENLKARHTHTDSSKFEVGPSNDGNYIRSLKSVGAKKNDKGVTCSRRVRPMPIKCGLQKHNIDTLSPHKVDMANMLAKSCLYTHNSSRYGATLAFI